MKDKTGGVVTEEAGRLKQKMYLFLVDNSENEKAKGAYKNIVVTIIHN